jgi:uncharacterized surface protein with fasciclin (FAS1) repeats
MGKGRWLALLACFAAAGCEEGENPRGSTISNSAATGSAEAPAEAKLATVISGNEDLGQLNRIVGGAGLTELLNGIGPYTVFAPTDAAIEALGAERASGLASDAMRPQAAALLRAHIVPGTLTRRDLEAAIAGAGNRPVRVRTMADTMLTFTREGDAVIVTSDQGGRARLTGQEGLAANGAVQPVDGLLLRAQ